MPDYEHQCYLSDGTVLSKKQMDELFEKGELTLDDGRKLKSDPKFNGEYLWSEDTIKSMKEK